MNISKSVNALNNISANFNKVPDRIADTLHNPESKEGLANVMTDMLVDKNAYAANAKAIKTMTTVEDMLLNELRNE